MTLSDLRCEKHLILVMFCPIFVSFFHPSWSGIALEYIYATWHLLMNLYVYMYGFTKRIGSISGFFGFFFSQRQCFSVLLRDDKFGDFPNIMTKYPPPPCPLSLLHTRCHYHHHLFAASCLLVDCNAFPLVQPFQSTHVSSACWLSQFYRQKQRLIYISTYLHKITPCVFD